MSRDQQREPGDVTVLVDVGSTYTKAVCVASDGAVLSSGQAPTATAHVDTGFGYAMDAALAGLSPARPARPGRVIASSSAAGGLRLFVVGLEASLTVEAGKRAAVSAGARVVGSRTAADLPAASAGDVAATGADIVLLTGGCNGGDRRMIVAGATALTRIAPRLPVVVAGNEDAYDEVRPVLADRPVVRFLPNVLPRIGEFRVEPVQEAIREIFTEHVMGSGRFASGSELAAAIRMPTPAAVLAGVTALARLGTEHRWLARPVVVDVGGATTDVHSVLDDGVRRSVEGDLGIRESAGSLLAAALDLGLASSTYTDLESAARVRCMQRAFLPVTEADFRHDRQLTELACLIALERHAGILRYRRDSDGGALRATGRDLRESTCFIGVGGVFARQDRSGVALRAALRTARGSGVLVPAQTAVLTDTRYLIWAVGLLESQSPGAGMPLARAWAAERVRDLAEAAREAGER